MDMQIDDDGKGIKFVATPMKGGNPTTLQAGQVPTWVLNVNPAALNFAADTVDDPTGLTAVGTIPTPPVDATALTVTISMTLANGTVITDTSDPFDIIQDPNNIDSFTIVASAQ